jgi:hypothetical protein
MRFGKSERPLGEAGSPALCSSCVVRVRVPLMLGSFAEKVLFSLFLRFGRPWA